MVPAVALESLKKKKNNLDDVIVLPSGLSARPLLIFNRQGHSPHRDAARLHHGKCRKCQKVRMCCLLMYFPPQHETGAVTTSQVYNLIIDLLNSSVYVLTAYMGGALLWICYAFVNRNNRYKATISHLKEKNYTFLTPVAFL